MPVLTVSIKSFSEVTEPATLTLTVIPALFALENEVGSKDEVVGVLKVPIALSLARSSPKAFNELVLRESVRVSICSLSRKLIAVPFSSLFRKDVKVSI